VSTGDAISTVDETVLRFEVTDTGSGLTPAQIDALFAPFIQADTSTTRRFGGTGLGLAISRQLVELMGGKIEAYGALGQGSTFSFTARFAVASEVAPQATRRNMPLDVRGLRVLVVEDVLPARRILHRMLESMSFDVTSVKDAAGARRALDASSTDLVQSDYAVVFMDWGLPDTNGLELTKQIKSSAKNGPPPVVVMVTAHRPEAVWAGEHAELLDGRVTKPVNRSRLLDATLSALGTQGIERRVAGRQNHSDQQQRRGDRDAWSDSPSSSLRGAHVLVVGANTVNQQIALEVLAAAGVQCEVANNGQEALHTLSRDGGNTFDAVLMDVQMPVMDGLEATRRIRIDPNLAMLPIIAMTAHAMPEERQRCFEAGMNNHVAKPFAPDEIFRTLERWVALDYTVATDAAPVEPTQRDPHSAFELPVSMPGIKISQGVARLLGNANRYLELAAQCPNVSSQIFTAVEAALDLDDLDATASGLHRLRGLAANLPIDRVAEVAATLDKSACSGSRAQVIAGLPQLRDALVQANDSLAQLAQNSAPKVSDSEQSTPGVPDITQCIADLDVLVEQLTRSDARALQTIRSVAALLADTPWTEQSLALQSNVDAIAFDAVLAATSDLVQTLRYQE
jgi:two-component system, sensor histidine kinase and response regulator